MKTPLIGICRHRLVTDGQGDMNPDIYRRYTSIDNSRVVENLRWLADHVDLA